jgi:hypothetical protein
MKLRRPPRPSPALVIACLALFVALGGTVLAATKIDGHTIRVKSLPGNRLVVGSLPGNRLREGTIPGSRLAPGSVKAKQIDVGSLGPVPSATHAESADSARHAQTATAAEHADDATTINGHAVGCRGATRQYAGACWDLRPSAAAVTATEAAAACAAAGGELPKGLALVAFAGAPGVEVALGGEWLNEVWYSNDTTYGVFFLTVDGHLGVQTPEHLHNYRCVTPLLS